MLRVNKTKAMASFKFKMHKHPSFKSYGPLLPLSPISATNQSFYLFRPKFRVHPRLFSFSFTTHHMSKSSVWLSNTSPNLASWSTSTATADTSQQHPILTSVLVKWEATVDPNKSLPKSSPPPLPLTPPFPSICSHHRRKRKWVALQPEDTTCALLGAFTWSTDFLLPDSLISRQNC